MEIYDENRSNTCHYCFSTTNNTCNTPILFPPQPRFKPRRSCSTQILSPTLALHTKHGVSLSPTLDLDLDPDTSPNRVRCSKSRDTPEPILTARLLLIKKGANTKRHVPGQLSTTDPSNATLLAVESIRRFSIEPWFMLTVTLSRSGTGWLGSFVGVYVCRRRPAYGGRALSLAPGPLPEPEPEPNSSSTPVPLTLYDTRVQYRLAWSLRLTSRPWRAT